MKDFLKMILAVVVGLILVSIISLMFLTGFVTALSGGQTQILPKSGILKIDMSEIVIGEQTIDDPMTSMMEEAPVTVGIRDAVNALKAAAADPGVKFVYLKTDASTSSSANLEEFRKALSDFRRSGKCIVSYIESPTTGSYWLASVADKVYMTSHPGSMIQMNGISMQMVFLKDILDKLGVNVQLIRHGRYKSAGEMYVRSEASKDNLEQYKALVNSVWGTLAGDIAESRGITVESFEKAANGLELCLPEDFLKAGLVDSLMDRNTLKQRLADLCVVSKWDDVKMIPFAEYARSKAYAKSKAGNSIAVIYASGEIIDGKVKREVAGDRFASIISKVRADSTVKAVVLRVNSPGGSVLASDKIKSEIDLLCAEKPVVASYGAYAASGGYWISNGCEKIFSDAVTLTGSIGVFGMVPDFSGTLKNIVHVNIQTVGSGDHADMYSMVRPFDNAEYAYMLRSIEDIYDRFTTNVAKGRGLEKSYVDEIGQGRVWTGKDALERGLVDEIGTLDDAIGWAAVAAGNADVKAWAVTEYPKPLTTLETMFAGFSGPDPENDNFFAGTSLEGVAANALRWRNSVRKGERSYFIARLPFLITEP